MGNDSKHSQAGDRAGAPTLGSRSVAGRPSTAGKGVRVSRVSKRPVKNNPRGVSAARRLLSEAEVTEGLRLDEEDLRILKACCAMRPPRNAAAIVSALKARLEYSQTKPKQAVEVTGKLTLEQLVAGSIPSAEIK